MTDPTFIRAVCAKLDPSNDAHWTSQGLPRMDVLEGLGLRIERRELNEALPSFNRAKAAEARAAVADQTQVQTVLAGSDEPELTEAQRSHRHALARAARRQEALEYLTKGGFTVADLAPHTSRLDQRIAANNRQARRELS